VAKKSTMVVIKAKGKPTVKFQGGRLHRDLNVPEDKPIPAAKKRAALAGKYGAAIKKRADFAFKGLLKTGRETMAKKADKKSKTTTKTRSTTKKRTVKRTNSPKRANNPRRSYGY
jgi:hypothetical protein